MKKKKIAPPPKKQRLTHSLETKAKAKRYFILGLTRNEISILVGAPPRTIENWHNAENWQFLRERNPKHAKALELKQNGSKYSEICQLMNISYSTVRRYIKSAKNNKSNDTNKN